MEGHSLIDNKNLSGSSAEPCGTQYKYRITFNYNFPVCYVGHEPGKEGFYTVSLVRIFFL